MEGQRIYISDDMGYQYLGLPILYPRKYTEQLMMGKTDIDDLSIKVGTHGRNVFTICSDLSK